SCTGNLSSTCRSSYLLCWSKLRVRPHPTILLPLFEHPRLTHLRCNYLDVILIVNTSMLFTTNLGLALMPCLVLGFSVNAVPQPVFLDSKVAACSRDQPYSLSRRTLLDITFHPVTHTQPPNWERLKTGIEDLFYEAIPHLGLDVCVKHQIYLEPGLYPETRVPHSRNSFQLHFTFTGAPACKGKCSVIADPDNPTQKATVVSQKGKILFKVPA
ncbi:hypothetical protein BDP27DRAFT_764506, partial [Rhodocollybia butyracea]